MDEDGECEFLTEIGAHIVDPLGIGDIDNVDMWTSDAPSDGERLIEHAGRMCYKSHRVGPNPNVTKIRGGNESYISNILRSGHGSVLEHSNVTFAFLGVSRVFTHELVRHRAGHAFSQESLRFVRLTKLMAYYPDAFQQQVLEDLYDLLVEQGTLPASPTGYERQAWSEDRARELLMIFRETFEYLEKVQQEISAKLYLDKLDSGFSTKKAITSAMRRLAPIGLGTAIICTANHRAWRHVIEMRASFHAEEEINKVYVDVARQLVAKFPNLYGDAEFEEDKDAGKFQVVFDHSKV